MLLSACLIVKDEEFTLKRCLDSLVGIADEIILVDTGSTDKTIDIAQTYDHVNVFSFPWDGDFSHARNESLRHAQGEFILVIDADEFLDSSDKLRLRDLLEQTDAEGLYVNIKNYVGSIARIREAHTAAIVRIFRNRHQFEGKIHEQVLPSIFATGKPIITSGITLHHLGYLEEIVALHKKIERNAELLGQELDRNSTDLFHRSNLMAELLRKREFEECINVAEATIEYIETNPKKRIDHIYLRVLIFYSLCLWETGKRREAIQSLRETTNKAPGLADIWYRLGHLLALDNQYYDAMVALQMCLQYGEPKDVLIDTIVGSGSFLAANDLALVWAQLGDEEVALDYLLKSFFMKPDTAMMSFDLVYYLRSQPQALAQFVEERLQHYHEEYCNYLEQYTNWQLPNAEHLFSRVKKKIDPNAALYRPQMANLCFQSIDAMKAFVDANGAEEVYLLWGIYLLEEKQLQEALEAFAKAGGRGEYLTKVLDVARHEQAWTWEALIFLRDFVSMGAKNTLQAWLPFATDKAACVPFLQHSPLNDILYNIKWPGETNAECQYNAVRSFQQRDLDNSLKWLVKGMSYSPTVSKILIECDIALAYGNSDHALKVLSYGKKLFEESKLLQRMETQLGTYKPTSKRLEELLMNPADIYRTRAVQTMPLNVQLAQLHERGAFLTKQVREDVHAEKLTEARTNIEEIQNIITFLRSSLNPDLEVSSITDQTYAFFYKTTVRWFIQPNSIDEDYEAMLNFWESWAQTWIKVKPKNA